MYIIIDKFESLVVSDEEKQNGIGEGYTVGFSLLFFLKKSDIAILKFNKAK